MKAAAVLLLACAGATPEAVVLDAPKAGWREGVDASAGFLQPVQYPAVAVSTETTEPAARVAGRIAGAPKSPGTMIVNGVAMPLLIAEDGSFSRPYSFARGSNSVEVRSGSARTRRQLYDAGDGTPVKLRVLLSWDSDGTDVDLHVVDPSGEHAFYGERVMPSGGALDVDVTTGFGPEIFGHPSPRPGIYHVYVNYYGAGAAEGDLTVAQVTILTAEGTAREKRQGFTVPLRKPGEVTLVHSFVYP